jgi:catechol 2,3-dioxygenase-like lactoylglutathione lyase family enzyme
MVATRSIIVDKPPFPSGHLPARFGEVPVATSEPVRPASVSLARAPPGSGKPLIGDFRLPAAARLRVSTDIRQWLLWKAYTKPAGRSVIDRIDHIVLTTGDLDRCLDFYTRVLGMGIERYGDNRIALRFGDQKFNVHPPGFEAGIKARTPKPGSLDLCFLADRPLGEVIAQLERHGVVIEEGPVKRTGARFVIRSIYVRDPDGNLIEISEKA